MKFSFHNSYLENGVQLGYPGYYATMLMVAWAFIQSAVTWLRNQTLLNAAFLILVIMIVIRANSEPDLGIEFGVALVLLLVGGLRKEVLGKPVHVPPPAPVPTPGVPGWTPPEPRRR